MLRNVFESAGEVKDEVLRHSCCELTDGTLNVLHHPRPKFFGVLDKLVELVDIPQIVNVVRVYRHCYFFCEGEVGELARKVLV